MKPPQHRILPLRYIDLEDPAWDTKRIDEELTSISDVEEFNAHPVVKYRRGETLFDLDAPSEFEGDPVSARDYLLEDKVPVVHEGRRLPPELLSQCLDLPEHASRLHAFQLAWKGMQNGPLDIEVSHRKPVSTGQLSTIQDALGYDLIQRVGRAFIDGSRPPLPAEKKPSASSLGST